MTIFAEFDYASSEDLRSIEVDQKCKSKFFYVFDNIGTGGKLLYAISSNPLESSRLGNSGKILE